MIRTRKAVFYRESQMLVLLITQVVFIEVGHGFEMPLAATPNSCCTARGQQSHQLRSDDDVVKEEIMAPRDRNLALQIFTTLLSPAGGLKCVDPGIVSHNGLLIMG